MDSTLQIRRGTRTGTVAPERRGRWIIQLGNQEPSQFTWITVRERFSSADEAFDALKTYAFPDDDGYAPDSVVENQAARLAIESFVSLWTRTASQLNLDPDVKRVGDAMSQAAAELAKADSPPKSVLRTIFEWFAHKLDLAADESAKLGGKVGLLAGGAAISGQLPKLLEAVAKVLQHLG